MLTDNNELQQLIQSIRAGDRTARERLFEELLVSFRIIVKHRFQEHFDQTSEDIAQEACRTVLERFPNANFENGFASWAHEVLRNHIGNAYQRRNRELARRAPDPDIALQADRSNPDPDFNRSVRQCFKELLESNKRYARVLNLIRLGFKTDEVCRRLEINRANCHTMLSRARTRLILCLESKGIHI